MLDEATVEELTTVVENHAAAQRTLLDLIMRILLGIWWWRGLRHDPILADGAVAETIIHMQDAMDQARELEVAFVAEYADRLGIEYDRDELAVDPVYVRDADMHDVYKRVMDEYRWQRYGRPRQAADEVVSGTEYESVDDLLADADTFDREVKQGLESGSEFARVYDTEVDLSDLDVQEELDEEAWQKAVERLETIVGDDLKRASDDAHQQMLAKKTIWLGYRRVIHPELSESGTCGLCVAAATRVYRVKSLAPMHSHCKCTTIGVSATTDVGDAINENDLDEAWELIVTDADGDESRLPYSRDDLDRVREKDRGRSDVIFSGDNTPTDFSNDELQRLYEEAGGTGADGLRELSMRYGVNENGPTIEWEYRFGLERAEEYRTTGRMFTPESLAVTRQKWYRTREWAGERYRSTQAAIEAIRGREGSEELVAAYERALNNFDNVAARMGDNLRTYR